MSRFAADPLMVNANPSWPRVGRIFHVNITAFQPFWKVHFHYSRMFASARGARWPIWKRLIYTGGAGLISLVRLKRHWPDIRRVTPPRCTRHGLLGASHARPGERGRGRIYWLEFHRARYLAGNDSVPDSVFLGCAP
ncbi:MAG: hypothetical protein KJZ70_10550 [Bryobacterales bacterium]|nr:hypothetical protein [Bryobacterales bacterium]